MPLLNCRVLWKRNSNGGGPLTKSRPIGEAQAETRHFENFTAILKIPCIESFVKLQCNLTHVFEGRGALTNRALLRRLMPRAKFREF